MLEHPLNRVPLLLGIDGGATKTVALLATPDGEILGRAHAGGSNLHALGEAATIAALEHVVAAAFRSAAIPQQPVTAACFGMAGVDRPNDRALIRKWAAEWGLHEEVLVVNDARLIIAAGTPEGWGVGVICGTGSIAVGHAPDGRTTRSGGWGYLLGDEGSGYDIAYRALRAITGAADGRGMPTSLLPAILQHWHLSQPAELIEYIYGLHDPRARMVELPPLVVQAAQAGDQVANSILENAGNELALAAVAVARQLEFTPPLPLAIAGGVIQNAPQVERAVCAALARMGWPVSSATLVPEPAQGAIRLARKQLMKLLVD